MYRSRPEGRMDDDILAFLSSIQHDQPILYYDIIGSEAHSVMLYEKDVITLDELKKILSALESAKKNPSLVEIEEAEDIHEALEAFVIAQAGMDAGGKMHTARSRNDQVVLDMRMKVRNDINMICLSIVELIESLVKQASKNRDSVMPLYTHTQQGQLGTYSHILLSYADALFRDLERLYQCFGRINQSPLGACAIGGTSIDIDRKRTAVLLGFDGLVQNSIDATTSRDVFLEYVASLSILSTTLARMAEDLIVWSTIEFGFIELDDRYSSTSSAMPQKKNPDPLELVRAKTSAMTGRLVAMLGITKALPSGYSRDLQDLKPLLLEASSIAVITVRVMRGVIDTTNVRKKRMLEVSTSSYAIALDVAEQLVTKGIPFRNAHKIVGLLVAKASAKEAPLSAVTIGDAALVLKSIKGEKKLGAAELVKIIRGMTPAKSIALRKSTGSPNPEEQDKMMEMAKSRLTGYRQGITKRTKFVEGSLANLEKTIETYMSQ